MSKNNEDKKQRKASLTTPEFIAETIYNPISNETLFAVYEYENGSTALAESVKTNKGEFYPLDAKSDIVSKNVVLLPSEAAEYETEEGLIHDVHAFIHKYLDISPIFEEIATYYVLFSWLYDRFHEVPYLRAIGDFGSGKSRFLQTIGSICYRPIFTGGATTTAPIFRILDEVKGTLVLDEADLKFSDMTADIIKILNMGYQRGNSVLRMQGKENLVVKAYDVFSPKVIATRETFDDKALESRFLVEEMGNSKLREDIPRRLSDEFYNEAREIRNKLLMWRFKNYQKAIAYDEKLIEGIHPRLHQIIMPLLAIIQSEDMKKRLKEFVQKYNEELVAERGLSWESDIALTILKLAYTNDTGSVTIKEITDALNIENDPNEQLHPRKVGWLIRKKLQLKTYKTNKGYTLTLGKNKDKLAFWKERFGITDKDIAGEQVNDVDVLKGPSQLPLSG